MNVAALQKLAYRFREARVLYAGIELGLFDALGREGLPVPELAAALDVDADALEILAEALVSMTVLRREGNRVALEDEAAAGLLPDSPEYIGNLLKHDLWHWQRWAGLGQTIRDGTAPKGYTDDRYLGDPAVLLEFLPNYNVAMEQTARESVPILVGLAAALAPRSILDVGGGTGALLLALLEALPNAKGVLLEHGFAIQGAKDRATAHPAGKRMRTYEVDGVPPGAHDLVVISRVLMGMEARVAAEMVSRSVATLAPRGHLLIHDFAAHSRVGAVMSVDMLLNTGGRVHESGDIERWIRESGLRVVDRGSVLPYTCYWIAAR